MIVITDLLRSPFDEGAKNTIFNIIKKLSKSRNKILSVNGTAEIGENIDICNINRAFFNLKFLTRLRNISYGPILYAPESSATFYSLIRSSLLNLFSGKSVIFFALQPRKYSRLTIIFIKLLAPKIILTPSISYADYLREIGLRCTTIPLGVDNVKYKHYCNDERIKNRHKFDIPVDKTILLHVGHIRESRNLKWLLEVKGERQDIGVIIVGSTYNESDLKLKAELELNDIKIINHYIENMADIYNLADYYIFPVLDEEGAIATPLSVLEAMSCNIPIITTRFGSLIDMFEPNKDFQFVENSADILKILNDENIDLGECNNRKKIENYTWKNIANRIEKIVGE